MKAFIFSLYFFQAIAIGKAQKIDSASIAKLNREKMQEANHYIAQARQAKTTGMVLAFGGAGIGIIGGIIFAGAMAKDASNALDVLNNPGTNPDKDYSASAKTGAVLVYSGAAFALASIPFFIKVHKKHNTVRAIIYSKNGKTTITDINKIRMPSMGLALVFDFSINSWKIITNY